MYVVKTKFGYSKTFTNQRDLRSDLMVSYDVIRKHLNGEKTILTEMELEITQC